MAISTNVQKETLAVAYGSAATHVSLHTGNPGTSGASEVSGGGYARKPITWTAGTSDGVVTGSVTIDVPASTTVTYTGVWTALTGGTFLDAASVTSQAFASAGQYTVNLTFTQT